MRNEIFNRIKKNRKQYYTELKSRNIKREISRGNVEIIKDEPAKELPKDEPPPENDDSKSKPEENIKSKLKSIKSSKEVQLVSRQIKQKMELIKNQYIRTNNKVKLKSDKLADGFYDFSSRLFDDKYNFEEHVDPDTKNLSLITSGGGIVEWTITNNINDRTIMDDLLFLPEIFQVWVKRIIINIMFWFNADEIGELKKKFQGKKSLSSKIIGYCATSYRGKSTLHIEKIENQAITKKNRDINHIKINRIKNSCFNDIDHGILELNYHLYNKLINVSRSFFSTINKFID